VEHFGACQLQLLLVMEALKQRLAVELFVHIVPVDFTMRSFKKSVQRNQHKSQQFSHPNLHNPSAGFVST
jgi:hypothetical protein